MKYDVTSVRQNLNNGSSHSQHNRCGRHTKNTQFVVRSKNEVVMVFKIYKTEYRSSTPLDM